MKDSLRAQVAPRVARKGLPRWMPEGNSNIICALGSGAERVIERT